LRLALTIGLGDWAILTKSNTSLVLISLVVLVVMTPLIKKVRNS
jgi:TctA family transporter